MVSSLMLQILGAAQASMIIAAWLSIFTLLATFLFSRFSGYGSDKPNVTVLVLGDIGRSPRMQYHALSLAKHGCNVSLLGYPGAKPMDDVLQHPAIRIWHIMPLALADKLPFTVRAVLKVLFLLWQLFALLLFKMPRAHLLLVQNPPAIPSLVLARLAASLQGAALVVDFHNFGYSLLALKLGDLHPLVRVHLAYEHACGRLATTAFCVTEQMKYFLLEKWQVIAVALHDRPAAMFRPIPLEEQHTLFARLRREGILKKIEDWWPKDDDGGRHGLFTTISSSNGQVDVCRAQTRPRLVISSTSWTADEDFGQLLEALPTLDSKLHTAGLRALIVVTGKGELKEAFEAGALKLAPQLRAVRVTTAWLSFADYAALLGSADLGLSLHTSSSGIDLPMKVVDMFGAGLPVCAKSFAALPELVQHGKNGLIFNTTEELAESLAHALGVPSPKFPPLESAAGKSKLSGWDEHWDTIAWPVILQELRSRHARAQQLIKRD